MPFKPVLKSLPLGSVKITDEFWRARQQTLKKVTLKHSWKQIESTGRLQNFRQAARKYGDFASKYCFDDSDVYKWLEACAYAFLLGPDPELQKIVGTATDAIVEAQQPDGYLNTFFQLRHPTLKFRNTISMHV